MADGDFFEQQTPSSRIKASIVAQYFPSYCKIISKQYTAPVIRYIDLFAGPGQYKDGQLSTPLLIAERCLKDEFLRKQVQFLFNDIEHSETLRNNFNLRFPDSPFPHQPRFGNLEVGQNEVIREFLQKPTYKDRKNVSPSLLFIDPFGYKGIETAVLAQFMKNWGNEVFIFVNMKRIHPALENDNFDGLMQVLFPTTLEQVRKDRRYSANTMERISLIINSLGEEYKAILGEAYYTAFQFQEEDSDATSHYILHITKHHRGYDLVKQIYTDFANVGTMFDGKHTYTFDAKKLDGEPEMFDVAEMNVQQLAVELAAKYAGRRISALELFDLDHKTKLHSRSHYVAALRSLVTQGRVSAAYGDGKTHLVSVLITKDCSLTFN